MFGRERERKKKQNKSTFSMNFNQGKSGKRAKKSRYTIHILIRATFRSKEMKTEGGKIESKMLVYDTL